MNLAVDTSISMFCMNRECDREAPLPEDTTVCPDCGFENENREQLHGLITCEACGKDNSQSSVSCWNCDTTLIIRTDSGENTICAGCGRPRSPLSSECPTCEVEEIRTTEAQLVQCDNCEEFKLPNSECWSCSTSL
jgi:hypothetical protein